VAKEKKAPIIDGIVELIKNKSLIFFNYEGIDVVSLTNVRTKLREQNIGSLKVIKNTYLKLALDKCDIKYDPALFKGMTAVAVTSEDFSSLGKVIHDAQNEKKLSITGGYYEESVVDADYVIKMASIPPRDVLYGMLVGCLHGTIGNLAYTLQAIAEQKQSAE
jgi:large subunit ribosomal protein L10